MAASAAIGGSTRLAGVIGWPVSHSRSPQMHNAAYAALGLDWAYVALPVPPERLAEAVRGLPALGFAGVNVTIPHKQQVAGLCHELSPEAERAGSVNTVIISDGARLHGDTTDGAGMLDAIGTPPATALVLGGGGAARAVVAALVDHGLDVAVSARRERAAVELAADLGCRVEPWPPRVAAGLVVNATPVGQSGDGAELPVDERLLEAVEVVCDLVYRADGAETGMIAAARRRGLRAVDGLDVLVGQGARSFRLFTGAEPPLDAMRAAVRDGGACDNRV
ncbi:MAG: shikimate dehydrogenase [Gaiellales bacterium]|jgi:shikimate dehydrogenase|nr:shikimate dehydrogenase [Gaiellales bacterium]